MLEIEDLHTVYYQGHNTVEAVRGIDLMVKSGSATALVGESGSGKSTAALSVMRLIKHPIGDIVQGRVRLDGRDLLQLKSKDMRAVLRKDIGFVPQDPTTALDPLFTVRTQIAEAHTARSRAEIDLDVIRTLERLGVVDAKKRLKSYPHEFSGGMRQRVAIAIALAKQPRLIIADEPTTALDVTIQAQILELMKQLTRRLDVALLIITHNLGVVARYANRVNVMYAGRIVENGPAAAIYHDPRHPYTMALLRSVPRLDRPRQARLDPVDGQPPDLTRLDGGCSFRPRCRFAIDACAGARPPLEPAGEPGHLAACFRSSEIVGSAMSARQRETADGVAQS